MKGQVYMKKMYFGIAGVMLMISILMPVVSVCAQEIELETEDQRICYSLGYRLGGSMITDAFEMDLDAFIQGIKDSMNEDEDAEPAISVPEMEQLFRVVQQRVTVEQERLMQEAQEHNKELAEINLMAGARFLEENEKQEGVITLPSGLQYKVLVEGTGEIPTLDSNVEVHYRGQLLNGEEFDSSYGQDPRIFGVGQLIPGWTEALQLMPVGSKWELYIPADLAYGPNGRGPIEPNSVLIFEMELLDIK